MRVRIPSTEKKNFRIKRHLIWEWSSLRFQDLGLKWYWSQKFAPDPWSHSFDSWTRASDPWSLIPPLWMSCNALRERCITSKKRQWGRLLWSLIQHTSLQRWHIDCCFNIWINVALAGADPGFSLGGGALNTNKPQFFCRIPVVLEIAGHLREGGGGAHPLHPPPRSAPALKSMIS